MLVGILIQFLLGIFTLRTKTGNDIFIWLGDVVRKIISYSDEGTNFVFGVKADQHFFAFRV